MAKTKITDSLARMQNFEILSVQIYRIQIAAFKEQQIIDRLRSALENEQEHIANLGKRLAELHGTPSSLGMLFKITGQLFSVCTRTLGKSFILKSDIWVEKQAIKGYERFLSEAASDDISEDLALANMEDEKIHIKKLQDSLLELAGLSEKRP